MSPQASTRPVLVSASAKSPPAAILAARVQAPGQDLGRRWGRHRHGPGHPGLIPVIPFTEQFARQVTPQAYWSSPTFKKINRVLSSGWGAAIVLLGISRVVAAAIHRSGGMPVLYLVFSAAVPVGILVYMLKFSKSYPEPANHSASGSPDVSSH